MATKLPALRLAQMHAAIGLIAIAASITGCRQTASIVFQEVPPASSGGSGTTALIRGRVLGEHRGRHIVLYSFAGGTWWVQPFASTPITKISEDGSWEATIHLGKEYAALLSKDDALPSQLLDTVPIASKNIEAVAVVKANGVERPTPQTAQAETTLRFSGLTWKVRRIPGDHSGKTYDYSPDNVSVDEKGALHLHLTQKKNGWICSEIQSVRSFEYGGYSLNLRDVSHLEPAVMFSAFSFYQDPKDTDHRELDIQITKRGLASNTNAEFIVQPAFVPRNFYHFNVPAGDLNLGFNWQPEEANFTAAQVHSASAPPPSSWHFKTGVPTPDDTHFYINLCAFGYATTPPSHDAEVVVDSFKFYP